MYENCHELKLHSIFAEKTVVVMSHFQSQKYFRKNWPIGLEPCDAPKLCFVTCNS